MKTRLLHTFTPRKFAIVIWKNNGTLHGFLWVSSKKKKQCPPRKRFGSAHVGLYPWMLNGPFIWHRSCPVWAQVWLQLLSFEKKIQVDEMWIPKQNPEASPLIRFKQALNFMEIIHEIQNSWGFGYQTSIPCVRVRTQRTLELRQFSQRLCQDKWDFADSTPWWKNWKPWYQRSLPVYIARIVLSI